MIDAENRWQYHSHIQSYFFKSIQIPANFKIVFLAWPFVDQFFGDMAAWLQLILRREQLEAPTITLHSPPKAWTVEPFRDPRDPREICCYDV